MPVELLMKIEEAIWNILNEVANSTAERPSTRSVLKEKLGSLDITFMAVLWGDDDDDDFIK